MNSIPTQTETEEREMIEAIEAMLPRFAKHRSSLIPILQAVQQEHGYLSGGAMERVAEYLEISPSEVYGVATFYNQFRFHPPGRHQIKVCLGTACHVAGGDIILENFERKLGIRAGETTPDREYSVERVACVGCCALAPVAIVDETVLGHMQPSRVEGLFVQFQVEREREEREKAERESGGEQDA
jgi:NADH-quinone oxidoreductase subunit E